MLLRPPFVDRYEYTSFMGKSLYTNCNFSIFLLGECNANCKFCVAHIRNNQLKNDKIQLEYIKKAIELVKPLNPTVSLSGGEPTLSPIFEEVCDLLKDFRVKAVTTNGYEFEQTIPILTKNDWTYLNISIPHYDDAKQKRMMEWNKSIEVSNIQFANVRLSCILSQEGINTKEEVLNYVNHFYAKGIRNFIFRQMTEGEVLSTTERNERIVEYIRFNKVDMTTCIPKEFTFFKENRGYYYWVLLYKYKDAVIAYEAADLAERSEAQQDNKIFELVLHPNGNLNYGWDPNKEILCSLK